MTEEARKRRKKKDHERYMANRQERLARQKAYYQSNRESCIASVKKSVWKRFKKHYSMEDTQRMKLNSLRDSYRRIREEKLAKSITVRSLKKSLDFIQ